MPLLYLVHSITVSPTFFQITWKVKDGWNLFSSTRLTSLFDKHKRNGPSIFVHDVSDFFFTTPCQTQSEMTKKHILTFNLIKTSIFSEKISPANDGLFVVDGLFVHEGLYVYVQLT